MIVCLCANVSERQLERVIADGARTVKAVGRACGAGAGCGECRFVIREQLRQARQAIDVDEAPGLVAPELAPA